MKKCPRCLIEKPDADFAWKNRAAGRLANYCRPCQAIYRAAHHSANGETQRANVRARKLGIVQHIQTVREGASCTRCGEDHPATLDFHHRDASEKEIGIAQLVNMGWSVARIDAEIAKCDVLCANCHRKLHWEQRAK